MRLLKRDGILLADNILRRGMVADSSAANPLSNIARTEAEINERDAEIGALDEVNKTLVGSERFDTFLMPMFDSVGMGRLID